MDSEFSQLGLISNKRRGKEKQRNAGGQRLIVELPFRDMIKKEKGGGGMGRSCRRTNGGEIRRARKGKVWGLHPQRNNKTTWPDNTATRCGTFKRARFVLHPLSASPLVSSLERRIERIEKECAMRCGPHATTKSMMRLGRFSSEKEEEREILRGSHPAPCPGCRRPTVAGVTPPFG